MPPGPLSTDSDIDDAVGLLQQVPSSSGVIMLLTMLAFIAAQQPVAVEVTATPPAAAEEKGGAKELTPIGRFLQAADGNDFPLMQAAMASDQIARLVKALTAADIIQMVSNC